MEAAPLRTLNDLGAFEDGLGKRYRSIDPAGGGIIEMLWFHARLTADSTFEQALCERVSRLAKFHSGSYGRIRGVGHPKDHSDTLALVSHHPVGVRLSKILAVTDRTGLVLDINAALCLVRQLLSAVMALHQTGADIAHGALGPERLIVTPRAHLVVVEHVLAPALEQLRWSPEQYWTELRIAVPAGPGRSCFDQRVDLTQIGALALSLVLGRPLLENEYPTRIPALVAHARASSARGDRRPLKTGLTAWLVRTLGLHGQEAFRSAQEAQAAFDELTGTEYDPVIGTLEKFLLRYHALVNTPALTIPPTPEPNETAADVRTQPMAQLSTAEEVSSQVREETPPMEDLGSPRRWRGLVAVGIALAILMAGGIFGVRHYGGASMTRASVGTTGTLRVDTSPPGAQVTVDGQSRGLTPLSLTLNAGPHVVELVSESATRQIPIMIQAGAELSQYVELPQAGGLNGQLQVHTVPAGASVIVDGSLRGQSPLTISDLAPGEHTVSLESDFGSVAQSFTVEPGATTSLVVPLGGSPSAPLSGWISVSAPVTVQLYEDGRLLGTSDIDRIMLPTGRHALEIVSDTLGYRTLRTIQVAVGRVTPITVELPNGTIALNAVPWAHVAIDGKDVGETPIGNLLVPIGPHEIVFRHPELGEQRRAITVTQLGPHRLSVDLTKP